MTSESSTGAVGRVLIVEDNEDSAETMQLLLTLGGYDVRSAHDGAAAVEIARDFMPQVVLCDIGLPGKNGFEVARELRELPETRNAFIVALTGYGDDKDRSRATEAGFNAFQVKPVEPEALNALLLSHFSALGR